MRRRSHEKPNLVLGVAELLATYGKLGRATDIQRVYRKLEAALAEDLDAEPTEETAKLRKKLIEELSQGSDA